MIENNPIKKMAASLTKKKRNVFVDRRIMHPEREWFGGIFLSLIVLLAGISFMLFQYFKFSDVSTQSVELPEEGVVYKSGLIKDVLDDFKVRKLTYEELKKELIGNRAVVEKTLEINAETSLSAEAVVDEAAIVEVEVPINQEEEVPTPTLSI